MGAALDLSDRVRLSTCRLERDALVDAFTGARHQLNPTGAVALSLCDGRRTVGEVAAEVGARSGVAPARVASDLAPFVGQLAAAGFVHVRRRWRGLAMAPVHAAAVAFAGADAPRPHALRPRSRSASPDRQVEGPFVARRRFRPTLGGCLAGTAHAGALLLGVAAVASAAAGAAVAGLAPGAPLGVALAPLLIVVLALATVAAHESGHLLGVRFADGRALFVGASATQVAVVHDVRDRPARRWVALGGPLAGAAAAVSALPLLSLLPAPADGLGPPVAVVLAAGHLAGLAPGCVDGRHLWGRGR